MKRSRCLQESFEGAETSELKGIFILSKTNKIVHINSHAIYSDDEIIVVRENKNANDIIRKNLFKLSKELHFEITVKTNRNVVQYMDT